MKIENPEKPLWYRHIGSIRGEEAPDILPRAGNRYCVTVREREGEAAYYFSVPVREAGTNLPVSADFEEQNDGSFLLRGTGSVIRIDGGRLTWKSRADTVRVNLGSAGKWTRRGETLAGGDYLLLPTLNGIIVGKNCHKGEGETLRISTGNSDAQTRSNTKSFAVMAERHTPSFVLSGLYAEREKQICPVRVSGRKDRNGWSVLLNGMEHGDWVLWYELDRYEPKLVQDTTVERQNPRENNAFGMMAFPGDTAWFGEQRLYFKWDLSVLSGILEKKLRKVRMFFHTCGNGTERGELGVYPVPNGFCSFGSNWEKRAPSGDRLTISFRQGNFCVLDLSRSLIGRDGRLKWIPGFLLKSSEGSPAIATGDCSRYPPILEFEYEA